MAVTMSRVPSPIQQVQAVEEKFFKDTYDALIDDGTLKYGMDKNAIQKALLAWEETGEINPGTSATLLPAVGEYQADSVVTYNSTFASTGSGTFLGYFSGSADCLQLSGDGVEIMHWSHFRGSISGGLQTDYYNSTYNYPDYGQIVIGAPPIPQRKAQGYSGLTTDDGYIPGVAGFKPHTFKGRFKAIADGSWKSAIRTPETGSDETINGASDLSAKYRPAGPYTAKWISGSFNNSLNAYSGTLGQISMSQDITAGTFHTSSNVTQADLRAISHSKFVGSICFMTGGFKNVDFTTEVNNVYNPAEPAVMSMSLFNPATNWASNTAWHTQSMTNSEFLHSQGLPAWGPAYHGSHSLDAVLEVAYFVGGANNPSSNMPGAIQIMGEFTNDRPAHTGLTASFYNNPEASAVISSVVGGVLFTLGTQGGKISCSIESNSTIERGGRTRTKADGEKENVRSAFFYKRQRNVIGARNRKERKTIQAEVTERFETTSSKIMTKPLVTGIRK